MGREFEDIITTAKKQITVIIVGGIISAFTINLIFIFSINNTIEELREYKMKHEKNIYEIRKSIFDLHKKR